MQSPDRREFQSEFARKYTSIGKAEGRAEEAARAIFAVLEARGLAVSAEQRARVVASTDLDELENWIRRAATAASADELFG